MSETVLDRRVVRTKRLIREALAELIEEDGLEGITVCNLTERADINRGTFYAHYKDKSDLLEKTENEIIDAVTLLQSKATVLTVEDLLNAYHNDEPMPFAVALFRYIHENGNFIRALIGPKGDPAFQPRLQEIVSRNTIEYILTPKYRNSSSPLVHYYVSYYTTAQLGVIKEWLESGMKESPEEMARIVINIMFLSPGEAIEMNEGKISRLDARGATMRRVVNG